MARAEFHAFRNLVLANIAVTETEVSATSGASMFSPGADKFLAVWKLDVDGLASNANTTGVIFRDGSTGAQLAQIEVDPGESKVFDFAGFRHIFNTTVWAQTIAEPVRLRIYYFEEVIRV